MKLKGTGIDIQNWDGNGNKSRKTGNEKGNRNYLTRVSGCGVLIAFPLICSPNNSPVTISLCSIAIHTYL